jgi:molybdopterin converting factor small subunit
MISISVKIHHSFKRFLPQGLTDNPFEISLKSGTTLGQMLKDEIKFPGDVPKVILINGLHAQEGQQLEDGDRVSLFAPIAGGQFYESKLRAKGGDPWQRHY